MKRNRLYAPHQGCPVGRHPGPALSRDAEAMFIHRQACHQKFEICHQWAKQIVSAIVGVIEMAIRFGATPVRSRQGVV